MAVLRHQLELPADLVVGDARVEVVRIADGDLAVIGSRHRAGARVDVGDVLAGIGEVELQPVQRAGAPRLADAERPGRAAALAGVGEHEVIAAGARSRGEAGGVKAGTAVGRRSRQHVLRRPQVLPDHRLADAGVDQIAVGVPAFPDPGPELVAAPWQLEELLDVQRDLPGRRDLEVGIQRVGDAVVGHGGGRIGCLGVRAHVEAVHVEQGQRAQAGRPAGHRAQQVTGVAVVVGDPHIRRTARVEADAARDQHRRVRLPVEAEPRHQDVLAAERGGVREAVLGQEARIERGTDVLLIELVAQADADGQLRRRAQLILDVEGVEDVRPARRPVRLGVVGGVGVAEAAGGLAGQVGETVLGPAAGVEHVFAVTLLHELVEHVEPFTLVAGREHVHAGRVFGPVFEQLVGVPQHVAVTGDVGSGDDLGAGRQGYVELGEVVAGQG